MVRWLNALFSRLWVRAILFALVYYLAEQLSREISFISASFLTFWLPSGLFLAVLLLSDLKDWGAYLLAAVPAVAIYGLEHGQTITAVALIYVSSVLEATTGARLVRRLNASSGYLNTPTHVLNLILFGALVSSALSATINTTLLATLQQGISYWETWRIGWIGHVLGSLVVAPLILSWVEPHAQGNKQAMDPERMIEFAILITGLFVCSLYIFVGSFSLTQKSYMVMPFLVWVAMRFGTRETTLCGLVIALVASWGTVQQLRGFANSDMTIAPNMDALGSFLGIILITSLILATVWEQGKQTAQALSDSEKRYRLLVENQAEGVAIVDAQEVFTFANPASNQIFGVDQLLGHNLREFSSPQQFLKIQQQTELRKIGEKTSYELEILSGAGRARTLLVSATPQYDKEGNWNGTFAVFHDITERIQAEVALRDSRARFQTLFDHSPIPIWEEDFSRVKRLLDGWKREGVEDFHEFFAQHTEQLDVCGSLVRVVDVNQAVLQQFNIEDKALFLAQVNKLIHRGPRDVFLEEMIAVAEDRTEFELEGPNDLVDGVVRYHYVRWTVAPGYEKDYRRVIVTVTDTTDRKQAEERMRFLSTHDVLTGLYNRNFFEAELDRLQNSRLEPINVMVVDINGMKMTNDTYGHAAGDELLRRTAQVLRMSFRKEDIIARIGGDEFVVLFHGSISIQDAVSRVKGCLADHNHWYEGAALSLSIGAASGAKGSDLMELFKKADQQMYKEKSRTRKTRTPADNKPE